MNQRSLRWRIPLLALVVALALAIVYPPFDNDGQGPQEGKLKLGLDLQGGMHLVLRVQTEVLPEEYREDATERALEIIRNRIDQFGVSEPLIQRQGKDQLVLQLPGITDRQRALDLVGKTAHLEFKLVATSQASKSGATDIVPHQHEDGSVVMLESETLLEGKSLSDASVQYSGSWNEPVVAISFDSEGAKIFADVTTNNINRQLAIILDGVVQSAPSINEPILTGDAIISGGFKIQEANDLAIALRAGALPAPIEILEERTVGPTLGRDSVEQGIKATLLAGLIVVAFMLVYYVFSGLVANAALCLNILLVGAALAYFKGTLTVPGIAGVILTIGMAVDTNVLILERIREELRVGKAVGAAIRSGYKKAFSAILDSNITTFLTALILFYYGTGPVRGFALTLGLGIVGSFFSGVFVTRIFYDAMYAFRPFKSIPMLSIVRGVPSIKFSKLAKPLLIVSVIAMVFAFGLILKNGNKNLGIDFTGGTLQEYRFEKSVEVEALREIFEKGEVNSVVIQEFGNDRDFVIRSPQGSGEVVHQLLEKHFSNTNPIDRVRVETVGPVVGKELRQRALLAVVGSLLVILIYLSIRFQFSYSLGAIVALFHDALICLGFVVLTGREITIPVLAALLTIVGYSVNDTIVIFDRIRENVRKGSKEPFHDVMNRSINESLSRTVLTSITTLLVVTALYVFGGPVINDFAFTMIVGVILGTYSTIYVACGVVVSDLKFRRKSL